MRFKACFHSLLVFIPRQKECASPRGTQVPADATPGEGVLKFGFGRDVPSGCAATEFES